MPAPSADVRVETEVHPTEDPAKVERAVRNLFPDAEVEVGAGWLRAEASDLGRLRDLAEDQSIQDTVRTQLRHGTRGDRIRVTLSKQAAYAGFLNVAVDASPLGDLDVEIEADDPELLIDRVAPSTEPPPAVEDEEGDAEEGADGPDGGPPRKV